MSSLDLIAKMKSTADFIAAASGADVTRPLADGQTLLRFALANKDLLSRYATARWLLDRGCPLGAPDSEGNSELHVLFGQVKHDIAEDRSIAQSLIAIGADVNAFSAREGLVFCDVLRIKSFDEDLEPIYELWFEQRVLLDFVTPTAQGVSPLSLARAVPYRKGILERMERYVDAHH
jgi:hypothetical protein